VDANAVLAELFALISQHLTEKQRRLLLGAGARALGRGGGARMARISGMARSTVYAGTRELEDPRPARSHPAARRRAPCSWCLGRSGWTRRPTGQTLPAPQKQGVDTGPSPASGDTDNAWAHRARAREVGAMIENITTLADLRTDLAEAEGRAIVNGLPYVDGAEVNCHLCRCGIAETDQVMSKESREGLLWQVTLNHLRCEDGTWLTGHWQSGSSSGGSCTCSRSSPRQPSAVGGGRGTGNHWELHAPAAHRVLQRPPGEPAARA